MQLKRVVVTGIGAITPIGNNLDEYWQGLLNGVSGCGPITQFDASKFKTRIACEIKGFDPLQYMEKKEARKLDRFTQIALAASDMAVKDAGITPEQVNIDRVGVIFASGIGGLVTFQDEVMDFARGDGTPRFNPFFIPKMILDIAAGQISMRHGFRGPNYAVVSACASSTNALIVAADNIRMGKSDIILSGGTESVIGESGVGGFNAMKALSAHIYCEIAGGGATADAYHLTAPHPEGLGARNVMIAALHDAGMRPEDIDYINTHGTSTPLGDGAELNAILEVFGQHSYNLNISSTKSMTGHCLGAAGVIEAIAAIKSVVHDIVPPTINHFTDDPELDPKLNYTFMKPQQRLVRAALSNTFGFGGHNACVIVKKFVA